MVFSQWSINNNDLRKEVIMKKSLLFILLTIGLFSQITWDVHSADYEMSANVTGILQLNFEETADGIIIGAFSGSECVGVAEPLFALDSWLYFLTIYSNSTGNVITFKAYFSQTNEIMNIDEIILFEPNAVYGSPEEPFIFNVVSNFDYVPTVGDIPNQTIEVGSSFVSIDLDNYLETHDNDTIIWSVAGNINLSIAMDENNIATITSIYPDWTGSETLVFTAMDETENGLSDSDEAVFTILPTDNPPIFSTIPNQTIGLLDEFVSICLNDYLTELDGDEIAYSPRIENPILPEDSPDWIVNPADYEMSMTVTAIVKSQGVMTTSSNSVLCALSNGECRGFTTAINALDSWIYFLTIYSNENDEEISFRFYDDGHCQNLPTDTKINFQTNASYGAPDNPILIQAGHYIIHIDNDSIVTIEIIDAEWAGNERITFIAQDQNTLYKYMSETTATFAILPDYAPQVDGIPNQMIEQGGSFEPIYLDNYLTEFDGELVNWSVSNSENFHVVISNRVATIEVITPEFIGEEIIVFTATDDTENGFSGNQNVILAVLPLDHPPEIQLIPNQEITVGEEFEPINLHNYLLELDGDEVTWDCIFVPISTPEQAPNWDVNPANFELSMTVTAVIESQGETTMGANHILAAFTAENQICGMESNVIEYNSQWLYFLTVYANTNYEEISFRFYDTIFGEIFPCKETIIFQTNQSVGDPMNPQLLHMGHFLVDFSNPNYGTIEQVNSSWLGTQDIQVIVQDQNTLHGYSDMTTITISVNVLLGDPTIDGFVNIQDVILIVNFALGMQTPTDDQQIAADLNEDGFINIQDVILVVNTALGITG